jgi:hypothetical protein
MTFSLCVEYVSERSNDGVIAGAGRLMPGPARRCLDSAGGTSGSALNEAAERGGPPRPPLFAPGRSSIGTETVPTYRAGDIRALPHGRVLVIHRSLLPILARTVDVSKRRDWRQLRDDTATIRAGRAPVDAVGHLHPMQGPPR